MVYACPINGVLPSRPHTMMYTPPPSPPQACPSQLEGNGQCLSFKTTAASTPLTPPRRSPTSTPPASPSHKCLSLTAIQTHGLLTPPDSPSSTPPRRKSPPASPNLAPVEIHGDLARLDGGSSSALARSSLERQVALQRADRSWAGLFDVSPKLRAFDGDRDDDYGRSVKIAPPSPSHPRTMLLPSSKRATLSALGLNLGPSVPIPTPKSPTWGTQPKLNGPNVAWDGCLNAKPKIRIGAGDGDDFGFKPSSIVRRGRKLRPTEQKAWNVWGRASNAERQQMYEDAEMIYRPPSADSKTPMEVVVPADGKDPLAILFKFRAVAFLVYENAILSRRALDKQQVKSKVKTASPTDDAVSLIVKGPREKWQKPVIIEERRRLVRRCPPASWEDNRTARAFPLVCIKWRLKATLPMTPSKLRQTFTAADLAAVVNGERDGKRAA